jgi:hypothetical protein
MGCPFPPCWMWGLAEPPVLNLDEGDLQERNSISPHLIQDGFVSVPFRSDRPFQVAKFEHFLMAQMPIDVFRAKGILWFGGDEQRHIFQLSGKRCSIIPEPWTTPPQNQLVFIGRQLNPLQLHQQLTNCLAGSRVSLLSLGREGQTKIGLTFESAPETAQCPCPQGRVPLTKGESHRFPHFLP